MAPLGAAIVVFICLSLASLCVLTFHDKFSSKAPQAETQGVVRIAANVFVVMTSLVLGLLINSVKGNLDRIDLNVHAFATEAILLDRALKAYGPETAEAHRLLVTYVERALEAVWSPAPLIEDARAEEILDRVDARLMEIRPNDPRQLELWSAANTRLQKLVELRWTLIAQSEGTIRAPMMVMIVVWLILIFASFGYQAPRNAAVVVTIVASAATIAGSIYLVFDMDRPFSGSLQVSPTPLQRALGYMRR
jgi:Protein of unknown function (DUF4239)